MKTELCDILGIEKPIICGAMAHISNGEFAAAVSNAGGLGVIATGFHDADWMEEQINAARAKTDKPFAVNLIMESPVVEDCAHRCVELGVKVCTISAGKPDAVVKILVEGGVKAICLIPHVRAAKKMQDLGVTAVIAEGTEGGGHIGKLTTMPMVRQVAEAVDIPVIAAGGIADGHGFVAALALGAVGVQMGTVFLASNECPICDGYKEMVVNAKDSDIVLTGEYGGKQVRCVKNPFSDKFWEMYDAGTSSEELIEYCTGSIGRAVRGDVDGGAVSAGYIAGLVNEIRPVKQIIDDVMNQADEVLADLSKRYL